MKLTIKEIAKKAGASVATVSRAMNSETRYCVAQETRDHIDAIVKKHNYVPNSAAKNLRKAQTHTIGVALPYVHNIFYSSYYNHLLAGVANALFSSPICIKPFLQVAINAFGELAVCCQAKYPAIAMDDYHVAGDGFIFNIHDFWMRYLWGIISFENKRFCVYGDTYMEENDYWDYWSDQHAAPDFIKILKMAREQYRAGEITSEAEARDFFIEHFTIVPTQEFLSSNIFLDTFQHALRVHSMPMGISERLLQRPPREIMMTN